MWLVLAASALATASSISAASVQDAQVAAVRTMAGDEARHFKYYCVSVNPGTLTPPFTFESRIRSTASQPDAPSAVLDELKDLPGRFVAASECERTKGDYDIVHRATKGKPALLVVVGPVEVVSDTEVRVMVFTTSGFLTETHDLVRLRKKGVRWEVVSSQILLQA
jgi:hypothetical protein